MRLDIAYDGDPISVAFNGNFILDFLAHVNSEKIKIRMNDTESSFVFEPSTPSDGRKVHICGNAS